MKQMDKAWFLSLFVILIVTTACSTVEAWERGHLAKPHMALDPNPMHSASRGHIYAAREAASSGGSAKGGGCGCY